MKKYRSSHVMMGSIVFMLIMSIPYTGYAQQEGIASGLRKSPQQEERQLTPVARKLINVELWLNKECGSPFYPEEKVQIYFKTDSDGYVTLYDIDTQGNVLVIFPNEDNPDNFVRAGQSFQIPSQQANYDLIVEGPEGIEYIEALSSVDRYYHWNYYRGEPRWLQNLNLKGRKGRKYEAGTMDRDTAVAYKESSEYQQAPKEFGATGLQSLLRNFQVSQDLRKDVQSRLVVRPRESAEPQSQPQEQPQKQLEPVSSTQVENYSTASCFMYIVDSAPGSSPPLAAPPSGQGNYLEQQEQEFRQISGLTTQLQQGRLLVELSGHTLFESGSSSLRYEAEQDLSRIARVFLRYPKTSILVMGHTDSVGDKNYNQRLSEARAKAVSDMLTSQGVPGYRLNWVGYGESMPMASNSTEAGRQRNRRVELEIRYER